MGGRSTRRRAAASAPFTPSPHRRKLRKGVVGQGLANAFLDELRSEHMTLAAELVDDRPGLDLGDCPVLLGMDGLQYVADLAHLGRRHPNDMDRE